MELLTELVTLLRSYELPVEIVQDGQNMADNGMAMSATQRVMELWHTEYHTTVYWKLNGSAWFTI